MVHWWYTRGTCGLVVKIHPGFQGFQANPLGKFFTWPVFELGHCQKHHLVGGIPTPLKNVSSSVGVTIPNLWKNKKCSKPPTSHLLINLSTSASDSRDDPQPQRLFGSLESTEVCATGIHRVNRQ